MKLFKNKTAMVILSIIATIFIYFSFFTITTHIFSDIKPVRSVTLSKGYDVYAENVLHEDVDISEQYFPTAPAGTVYSITSVLPDDLTGRSIMAIYALHSKVEVIVDGETIYRYGFENRRMFGYGELHVPMLKEYRGKTFTIVYTVMEDNEVSSIFPPTIYYEADTFYRNMTLRNVSYLMMDFALLILSLVFGAVALVFMFKTKEMIKLVFLALSIFGLSLWLFCNHDLVNIFSENLALRGYIEYLSFYISPFFFTLYFFDDYYVNETSPLQYVYITLTILQGLFATLSVVLHVTDIVHLPALLPVSHVLIITVAIFLTFMAVRSLRIKKHMHRSFLIGFIVLIGFALRDLILFVDYHYIRHSSGPKYMSRMLVGTFIFAVSMFVDFFGIQSRRIAATLQAETYNKMAHTDIMTGLANRRQCEEEFAALAKTKNNFAIINFDLNDLKKTNDNFGHNAGDQLLSDFADLLSHAFVGDCIICRTGGDEFIGIVPDIKKVHPGNILRVLAEKRNLLNKTRMPLPLSYACGYCTSDDPIIPKGLTGIDLVNEVNKVSDARMYENKAQIKAAAKAAATKATG